MKRYGVAVLGTGGAAMEHMKAYAANPHVDLVAILSRDEERARAKVEALGISPLIYTDYEKLLFDKRVDIVSICTPNYLHAQQATRAAEAGKHMLIEKPMAITWEDARAVRDAAKRAGIKAMVGFVLHWTPLFPAIQKLLTDGAIGRVFMAEGHYWEPAFPSAGWSGWEWWTHKDKAGSALLAGGCHAVDAIRSLVGPVSEVMAYSTKVTADFDYDPTIVATVRFANGAVGKLSATLESVLPFDLQITLLGTKGTIRDNHLFSLNPPGQPVSAAIDPVPFDETPVPPFKEEVDDFVRCVVEDRDPPLGLDDAVQTHEIIFAIDRSAAAGRPVKLPLP